ncbi:MAG: N-carbamoyl-D-amino-acid hydrolase [Planctomycetes bacterium]|nr:N-carbamoyl-D-amino-acid hydrolase [Planctomycetota bacterium]
MPRYLTIAAAQSGPISRQTSRSDVVAKLIDQLREARARGCELVVFTECALTAFFSHWWIDDEAELDAWFERDMPSPVTQPLFDEARRLGIGFCLGYAELAVEAGVKHRYNTSILVAADGTIVGKYRKIHLPGYAERHPHHPFQNLEKRYFEIGNLGFRAWHAFGGVVGMCICNDRRWVETYRVLALQGAELILLGYNTPDHIPDQPEIDHLCDFHHLLSMQAGAYQNGCWVVGVAKAGVEEGVSQIGETAIIAPSGEIVAKSATLGDELVVCRCDLDLVRPYKERLFNFAKHRRIEHYGRITTQTGATPPP